MPNYIVTYTIKNDDKRKSFEEYLKGQGITEATDQSTRYGTYNGTPTVFEKILKAARKEYTLAKDDVVILYYAANNKSGNPSIFIKNIE